MNAIREAQEAFGRLLTIMDELREKCPWDQKQTMESLRPLSIEELYELTDAILKNDPEEIKKELGDVLLHIVFYSKIGSENGDFDISQVIHSLCDKLIFRHPHIYGDVKAEDEETVKQNWEQLKKLEGNDSVLSGVPAALPSLVKAYRVQDKAAQVGFDWNAADDVIHKVKEELQEMMQETDFNNKEMEFGDLLVAMVNYARHLKINPDNALERASQKFIQRFQAMEKMAENEMLPLENRTLEDLERLWQIAKLTAK